MRVAFLCGQCFPIADRELGPRIIDRIFHLFMLRMEWIVCLVIVVGFKSVMSRVKLGVDMPFADVGGAISRIAQLVYPPR